MSLKALRVYLAEENGHPVAVPPPQSPRKYWTRKGVAEWLVERLWRHGFALEGRTFDQHDAFCIAGWLARADRDRTLALLLKPDLSPAEREVAQVEGWILGVPGDPNGRKA
ncbi:MAG TPA: hypothetical protein VFS91_07740 [Nitrobacter sp.]|nr:hypothetical protein [Nitrobacter sp.]